MGCTLRGMGAFAFTCIEPGRCLLLVHAQILANQPKSDQLKKHLGMHTFQPFPIFPTWPPIFHENASAAPALVWAARGGNQAVPCHILLIHANISSLRIPVWQVRWGICFSLCLFVFFFFLFYSSYTSRPCCGCRQIASCHFVLGTWGEFIPALLMRFGQSCAMGHVHEARALPGLRFSTFTQINK